MKMFAAASVAEQGTNNYFVHSGSKALFKRKKPANKDIRGLRLQTTCHCNIVWGLKELNKCHK